MLMDYTLVIVKSGRWYAGYVRELPGAHSQGKTIKEVEKNIKEAIRMVVQGNYRHFVNGQKKVLEEKVTVAI